MLCLEGHMGKHQGQYQGQGSGGTGRDGRGGAIRPRWASLNNSTGSGA